MRSQRPYRSPRQARYLYFATSRRRPGLVKIGITDQPAVRMHALGCKALHIFEFGPGLTYEIEKELHRHYRELRVDGEWFHASHTLLRELTGTGDLLGMGF